MILNILLILLAASIILNLWFFIEMLKKRQFFVLAAQQVPKPGYANILETLNKQQFQVEKAFAETDIVTRNLQENRLLVEASGLALRESLSPLISVVQQMKFLSDLSETDPIYKHTLKIESSLLHSLYSLNDLDMLSSRQNGAANAQPSSFSLKNAVEGILKNLKSNIQENSISFTYSTDDLGKIDIESDVQYLNHIFFSLVKHSTQVLRGIRGPGHMTLKVDSIPGISKERILLRILFEDSSQSLREQGLLGISDLKSLVEAANRTPVRATQYLSLYAIYNLVKALDGSVHPFDNGQTQFGLEFLIPLTVANSNAKLIRKSPLILLTDDQPNVGKMAKRLLSRFGLKCDVAISGEQAISMSESKDYEIIFMDINMPIPGISGLEAASAIAKAYEDKGRELVIVMLSVNQDGLNDAKAEFGWIYGNVNKERFQAELYECLLNLKLITNEQILALET